MVNCSITIALNPDKPEIKHHKHLKPSFFVLRVLVAKLLRNKEFTK